MAEEKEKRFGLESLKSFAKLVINAIVAWANNKFALKSELPSDYLTDNDLAQYFNAAPKYNSESKKIEFYHDTTKVAELDATAFIKDGMVNTVTIADGKTDGANSGKKVLLITFNTDSGKEDIELPLSGIFDASNYMTKVEVTEELKKYLKTEDASKTYQTIEGMKDYLKTSELGDQFEEYTESEIQSALGDLLTIEKS